MKPRIFLFSMLAGMAVFLASCQKPVPASSQRTKASPKLPIAYRQVQEWNVPPSPQGQGSGLQGIAVDHAGNVYVADAEGRRILVYSPKGKLLRTFKPTARHPKILQRPYGLMYDGHQRLYVTDYDADQVQVFDTRSGKFLFAWGREGKKHSEFRAPVGIAQDRAGNIYVVEFYGMRIQKFTHNGKFILTWGTEAPWGKPAPPEELLYPDGLAVGPDGKVYVTDAGHDTIKVFSPGGKFLRSWDTKGVKPGDLNAAGGLSFDANGHLHEADAANHRVQMFTKEGQFLGEWYLPDAGKLKVWTPTSLCAAGSRYLYLSDTPENRIYKLLIQPPA